jgi:hypothetical protein
MATRPDDELLPVEIREVWAANLEDEFAKIHDSIDDYPYVDVDMQHPPLPLCHKSLSVTRLDSH